MPSKTNWDRCSNSCLSSILIPATLVTGFKKLYRRRVLDKPVFNGKPLHPIDEIVETQLLGSIRSDCDLKDVNANCSPDEKLITQLPDYHVDEREPANGISFTGPSASLMEQFELEAKHEAATIIQAWYRGQRLQRQYLQQKQAAVTIQQWYCKQSKKIE